MEKVKSQHETENKAMENICRQIIKMQFESMVILNFSGFKIFLLLLLKSKII